MVKKNKLREFIKNNPAEAQLTKILDSLSGYSDHATALMGSALIESALEQILIHQFKKIGLEKYLPYHEEPHKLDPKIVEKIIISLFSDRGPLSDLYSKALIGISLGCFPYGIYLEINAIRSIRNAFAHARSEISFDTPEIDAYFDNFISYQAMKKSAKETGGGDDLISLPNKEAYSIVVKIILIMLDQQHQQNGGKRLHYKFRSSVT